MFLTRTLAAAFVAAAAAGCTAGGNGAISPLPAAAPIAPASTSGAAAPGMAMAENAAVALGSSSANRLLFVGNVGNDSISVYSNGAQGNVAPLRVIAGSNTGIDAPGQLAQDNAGNLYVANGYYQSAGAHPGILVFAPGASGNVAPIRTLAGAATRIHAVLAMSVSKTTGDIFVVDQAVANGSTTVRMLRFSAGANGDTPPSAITAGGLYPASELAFDSTGTNVIEAHTAGGPFAAGFGVDSMAARFANNAQPSYAYRVFQMATAGVADDPSTRTYLETSTALGCAQTCGIYRLAENAAGYGPFGPSHDTLSPAPVAVITSETCAQQIAVGAGREIYVTRSTQFACPVDAVRAYGSKASGNASPLRELTGSLTGLSSPYGILEGQ